MLQKQWERDGAQQRKEGGRAVGLHPFRRCGDTLKEPLSVCCLHGPAVGWLSFVRCCGGVRDAEGGSCAFSLTGRTFCPLQVFEKCECKVVRD